jgi:hypothetical protein
MVVGEMNFGDKDLKPLYLCNRKRPCNTQECGNDWWCNRVTETNKEFAKNKGAVELYEKFMKSFYFISDGETLYCIEKEDSNETD